MRKVIAITTNSHRQSAKLPGTRAQSPSSGLPLTLGSKTRVWYYDDTPENRALLVEYKIHKRETEKANKLLAEMDKV